MKLVPLGEQVILRRMAAETSTAGGIVLPEAAQERPRQGRVLSVGEGRRLADGRHAPMQVSEGDRVLFASYAGTEVLIDGEKLLILPEKEILAVVL